MSADSNVPRGDRASDVERILRAAGNYQPVSEMPNGLVRRALSHREIPHRRRSLLPVYAVIVILITTAIAQTVLIRKSDTRQEPGELVTGAGKLPKVARRSGNQSTMSKHSNPGVGVVSVTRIDSIKTNHTHGKSAVKRAAEVLARSNSRYYRTILHALPRHAAVRLTQRPAPRMWRTEVEQSEVIGYITPAFLATPSDQYGQIDVSHAALAVTVSSSTTVCRSPIDDTKPQSASNTMNSPAMPSAGNVQGNQ